MGTLNLVVKSGEPFPRVISGRIPQQKYRTSNSHMERPSSYGLTVGEVLASAQPLPAKSLLLGRCADGLPFLMSMSDPAIGSILIRGEGSCGKTHQLQAIMDAAVHTCRPSELQITVIAHNPSEWEELQDGPQFSTYLQGVFAWYDPSLADHIQRLTAVAEARRAGAHRGPANLVILDDLNFIEILDCESQVNLRWLLEYGPQSDFWMIGALNASLVRGLPFWTQVFRTTIFGSTQGDEQSDLPNTPSGSYPESLEPGHFRAWDGNAWITYQLPLLGNGLLRRK
jgi:hypothetical protein